MLALRVEWTKAKARAERWWEEVVLLNEEMRRVLQFCEWKQLWWHQQLGRRVLGDSDRPLMEGLHAYAAQQAGLEVQIVSDWSEKWGRTRAVAQPIIDEEQGWETAADFVGEETTIEVWVGDGEGDVDAYDDDY